MDRRGRVRVSVQRRQELLAQYDKGEMTAAQFATFAGIKYQTLCGWVQRRKRNEGAVAGQQSMQREARDVQWVEAVVEAEEKRTTNGGGGVLVVHLRGGARMEIGDPLSAALAAEVLRNLAAVEERRTC